ncbi:ABC transporter permease [Paracoccus sp. p3-h83]|uniref:ABC transporter permease n=1 Tax=Paracoccus sp. p3-h83 TaxID=3342805 RepID=UPI0035B822FD
MADLWAALPNLAQDLLLLAALLAPAMVIGALVLRGYRIAPLLAGLIRRQGWISATFVALIAVSVGIGTGLIAQERGLRAGTARAADRFDLVIARPGSDITAMLAAVYLQASDMALIDGPTWDAIARHPNTLLAAPIGFGDSYHGAPVVGTTAELAAHLSGPLAEGRAFATESEAIAGADVPLAIGTSFTPAHGIGHDAEDHAHEGSDLTVTGRMARTGTPWDRALLVPIETLWEMHALPNGHGPGWDGRLGPPFDPAAFPGTPAVVVQADSLAATYGLQAQFSTDQTMAFFPGTVLARLHGLMGDVRQAMSVLALVTQVLVTVAVLAGLMLLTRLIARRLALLRGLGAPARFVFALTWGYAVALIAAGAVLGLGLGLLAARVIAAVISARTDIHLDAGLGWPEAHLVAGFVSLAALLALLPALLTMRRPVLADLRA